MAVQSKFPFLKPPMLAYQNIVRTMEHPERITTSLCSKKLRRIVKTSLRRSRSATLQIRPLWIRILTSEQYDGDIAFELEDVRNILSSKCTANDGRGYTWDIPTLTVKDWFKHLLDVTNCNWINVQLKESGLSVQDLYVLTQGLRIEKVEVSESWLHEDPWLHEALITFYPAKSLQLEYNFQDRRLFQNIVSRGYDTIDFECRTSIVDIFSIGSKSAFISYPTFPVADLNAVIRAWFEGWIPNLKLLKVFFVRNDDPHNIELVLNGFEYQKVVKKRRFHSTEEITHTITVGYDIVRRDGVRATVAEERKVYDDRRPDGTLITFIIWS